MASDNIFSIGNSVLTKYNGSGANVVIPSGVKKIGGNVFRGHAEIKTVIIPEGVTHIGSDAFADCTNLTAVIFPDTLERIFSAAFAGCEMLESVTFPRSMISIGSKAFKVCRSLKKVTLPAGLEIVPENCFEKCENLESVTIQPGVAQISCYAFLKCAKLKQIDLPDTLKSIHYMAFEGCTSLNFLTIPKSAETLTEAFYTGAMFFKDRLPDEIPPEYRDINAVTGFVRHYKKSGADERMLGAYVDYLKKNKYAIGFDKFAAEPELIHFAVNNELLSGEDVAVLLSLMPDGDMGEERAMLVEYSAECGNQFDEFEMMDRIFDGFIPVKNVIGEWCFTENDDGSITIVKYVGTREAAVCPAEIEDKPVTGIATDTFFRCSELTSLTIPGSIKNLGKMCIHRCPKLTTIVFAEGIEHIPENTVCGCAGLAHVTLPDSIKDVASGAFIMCDGLSSETKKKLASLNKSS